MIDIPWGKHCKHCGVDRWELEINYRHLFCHIQATICPTEPGLEPKSHPGSGLNFFFFFFAKRRTEQLAIYVIHLRIFFSSEKDES